MLIKDIPFKAVREMALSEQFEYDGFRDEENELNSAFRWVNSKLGVVFWGHISYGEYKEARKIWDWDKEEY